jgi:hypothetical protein
MTQRPSGNVPGVLHARPDFVIAWQQVAGSIDPFL